jgi:FAD/FMN-containing dehydrogenase
VARLEPEPGPVRTLTYPQTTERLAGIVGWARECKKDVCPRNGGHSYEWYSICNDGVVVNMAQFIDLEMGPQNEIVTVGAGNTNWSTYQFLLPLGLVIPGGSCGTVGITGLALGGGLSMLERRYGLTVDALREVTMVLASGEVVTANATNHPELFWASRGAGGRNFGIVTEMKFQVYDAPIAIHFAAQWDNFETLGETMSAYEKWLPGADREFFVMLHLHSEDGGGAPITLDGVRLIRTEESAAEATADVEAFLDLIDAPTAVAPAYPVTAAGRFVDPRAHAWLDILGIYGWPLDAHGHRLSFGADYKATSHAIALDNLWSDPEYSAWMKEFYSDPANRGIDSQFDTFGGEHSAASKVPATDTPVYWRDALYTIQYIEYTADPDPPTLYKVFDYTDNAIKDAGGTRYGYRNYADINLGVNPNGERGGVLWYDRYYGANAERLMAVKACYDPTNFFNYAQSIPVGSNPFAGCPIAQ